MFVVGLEESENVWKNMYVHVHVFSSNHFPCCYKFINDHDVWQSLIVLDEVFKDIPRCSVFYIWKVYSQYTYICEGEIF